MPPKKAPWKAAPPQAPPPKATPPKAAPKAPPLKAYPTQALLRKAPPPEWYQLQWRETIVRVLSTRAETIAREARETAVAIRWQTFVRRLPRLPVAAAAA